MEVYDYLERLDPYQLLGSLQNEEENCKMDDDLMQTLLDAIDSGKPAINVKNDVEDLVAQIVRDYFARGMKVGAQMYVALMERQEEEL